MGLRRRIERHPATAAALGGLLAAWIRLCHATTRWEARGEAELEAALADGPVVVVLWHERSALPGPHWRRRWGPVASLHADSFMGRVAGVAQARLGLRPMPMAIRGGNLPASREVLRRLREGQSVGLTADGPLGPARVVKAAPLDWARVSGRPIFVYAWSARRLRRLRSWDRLAWPCPFTRGVAVWRRWDEALPRRVTPEEAERLRLSLGAALDAAVAEAEALAQPQRS